MDPERIELLILARLAGPTKKPPIPSKIRADVGRFAARRVSASEWRRQFDERLAALRSRALVTATGRLAITDAGRAHVRAALGVATVPNWKELRRRYLPALGLALNPKDAKVRARAGDADGLRAATLSARYQLPGTPTPTANQAIDALCWRALGVDSDRALTLGAVRAHLLGRYLAADSDRTASELFALLAAQSAPSQRIDPDAVRDALTQRWLSPDSAAPPPPPPPRPLIPATVPADRAASAGNPSGHANPAPAPITAPATHTHQQRVTAAPVGRPTAPPPTVGATPPPAPAPVPPARSPEPAAPPPAPPAPTAGPARAATLGAGAIAPPPFDLAQFARLVRNTAATSREGRFGDRKVFISALWRQLRDHPICARMDLALFKAHLVDANRADLLALHRADLVAAMDPAEVEASQTHYGTATFHFVERPSES